MLYKQKGLVQVVHHVFPYVEHRFCVRHLHLNMKHASFGGDDVKIDLWKVVRATTMNEFEAKMNNLSGRDLGAYEWLQDKRHQQ